MRIRARLVTYNKPDAQGDIFRCPVRWDDLHKLVGFGFQSVANGNVAGRVLRVCGHSEGVDATLKLNRPYSGLVPVIAFAVPGFREEGGARIVEKAQLIRISMVPRDKAILPADFFLELVSEPPLPIEIRKAKP